MEILLTLGVMGACFLLLGAGLLLKRRKICLRGSCGGLSSGERHPDISCPTCEGDAERCTSDRTPSQSGPSTADLPVRCKDADQSASKGKPGVESKT